MKREAYPAAAAVSPKLHAYFACHRGEALRRGAARLAPLPDAADIAALIDAAFWTSLRREEGYVPRISLAFLSPQEAHQPLLFERPLALAPEALTKVAPAVERPGIHLGVWRPEGELCVWGTTRGIPLLSFVLEVSAPGLLVIKHHNGEENRKFINVAVLEGDQIKLVEECPASKPEFPLLVESLIRFEPPAAGPRAIATMVQLAVSMREHRRGGSLLMVPAGNDSWQASILQPMPYGVAPPFRELACLHQKLSASASHEEWQEAVRPAIAATAGLTAVDGALVLNSRYELLGFGAKIVRRRGWPRVEEVVLSEPIQGATAALVRPDQLGGTRHLSAAQFVHDQHEAVALVASQDGRFTVFQWSAAEAKVRAHRVETLLL